jgi:hypothetical protein
MERGGIMAAITKEQLINDINNFSSMIRYAQALLAQLDKAEPVKPEPTTPEPAVQAEQK